MKIQGRGLNRSQLPGCPGGGLMFGGLIVATAVALSLLRSVTPTQIESYHVAGRHPVARFRIATFHGAISEIWIIPATGTPLDELIALPNFEDTWPFTLYEAYANKVTVAEVIINEAPRAQLRDLLAGQEESATQWVIKAECGLTSMRTNAGRVEYLVVAPTCQ